MAEYAHTHTHTHIHTHTLYHAQMYVHCLLTEVGDNVTSARLTRRKLSITLDLFKQIETVKSYVFSFPGCPLYSGLMFSPACNLKLRMGDWERGYKSIFMIRTLAMSLVPFQCFCFTVEHATTEASLSHTHSSKRGKEVTL